MTTGAERYAALVAKYRDRSYVIQPSEHVGHVVQIVEADPIDTGALRARCSCGATWAVGELALRGAFERNIETSGPAIVRDTAGAPVAPDYQRALVDVLNALDPKSGRLSLQDVQKARAAAARLLTDEGRAIRDRMGR